MKPAKLAVLASIALLGLGCKSPSERISEKITEKAVEGYVNANIDGSVDLKDGTVQYKGDGVTAAYGQGAKLPENFPNDVSVYAGANLLMASVSDKDNAASLMATSSEKVEVVSKWYETKLKADGWMQVSMQDVAGTWYREYSKGSRNLIVAISGDSNGTTITMSVNAK